MKRLVIDQPYSQIFVVQTFIEKSISVVRKIQDMNISWQDRNISI